MPITHLHSYLIHPGKNLKASDRRPIRGTTLDLSGQLYTMLSKIYDRAREDCTTAVSFTTDNQSNDARDLIVSYASRPRRDAGHKLAKRLQTFTDGTPGMGLLFLVRGKEGTKVRTVISRFPADVGILAEEQDGSLTVEYLEKVFMRNSHKYKAAFYEHSSLKAGYWKGHVVDHQISYGVVRSVSDYWVIDFLASNCLTTPALGSARLAKMLGEAVKKAPNPTVRDELVSAARLVPNLVGKKVSGDLVSKQFSLSPEAASVLSDEAKTEELYKEEFILDRDAFTEVLSYKSVELDTGAILSAPSNEFDTVFVEEVLDESNGLRLYKTQGTVADQRFKKVKP